MKKTIFSALVLSTLMVNAQVSNERYGRTGINTTEPKASFEVRRHDGLPSDRAQGVLFPKFSTAERSLFTNVEVGTMIFNTDQKCIEMYMGVVSGVHQWNCLPDTGSSQQQNISITPVGFEGAFIQGVALNNTNKVKFKLINNSFSPVSNVDFSSAVTIQNGTANITIPTGQNNNVSLASGQETVLAYTMNGSPENGSFTASFNRLGLTATQNTTVGMGRADIKDRKEYLVSLTYNGTDIQGKMNNTTNKFKVKIPYTNGLGSYTGFTQTKTTNIASGQGGDQNQLTLTISAGNYGVNGELIGEITVSGTDQEFLAKMLAPAGEEHITTFDVDMNGTQYKVELWAIGGIPDRKFGKETNGQLEHQFIYIPIEVTGANGYRKTWLNNNLGAEYADANNPRGNFNPIQQAINEHDWKAYGSLFQWQRPADGHELINRSERNNYGVAKYSVTRYLWYADDWAPNHPNFIIQNDQYQWNTLGTNRETHNKWISGGANNPCPEGYHVPTGDELNELYAAKQSVGNWNVRTNNDDLRLIRVPYRRAENGEMYDGNFVYYWGSTSSNSRGCPYGIHDIGISHTTYAIHPSSICGPSYANPIRCIKD